MALLGTALSRRPVAIVRTTNDAVVNNYTYQWFQTFLKNHRL